MEMLDGTIVITALPAIAEHFNVSLLSATLTVSVYLVVLATLIPFSAWLGGRFGARKIFILAIGLFALASLGCALSHEFWLLLLMRAVQAAAGAMMVPVGRAMVFTGAPPDQLVSLVAIMIWPALTAPVLAPLAGSIILTLWGWEWIFIINLLPGALLLAAALLIVPAAARRRQPFDFPGALLMILAVGGFMTGVHIAADFYRDELLLPILLIFALSLLSTLGLARHLNRSANPLVNLEMLRFTSFRASHTEGLIFWSIASGVPLALAIAAQTQWQLSPWLTGLLVTSIFLGNLGIKPFTSWMIRRFAMRTILLFAFALLLASLLAMGLLLLLGPQLYLMALLAFISGIARSIGMTGYSTLALADIPPALGYSANAFIAAAQQMAVAMGAVLAATAFSLSSAFKTLGWDHQSAGAFFLLLLPLAAGFLLALRLPVTAGDRLKGENR